MKTHRSFGLLGPLSLFSIFWFFGVILPIAPFLAETDGFSMMWPYSFVEKTNSLIFALFVYILVLVFFAIGCIASIKFFSYKITINRKPSFGRMSFVSRAFIVSTIGLLSIPLLIYILGDLSRWLYAGSDRIREHAGLNSIVLFQNGLLSVSLGWFIKLTDGVSNFRIRNHYSFLFFSLLIFLLVSFQGSKATLFTYLFAMIVIWHVNVKPLKFLLLALMGIFLYVSLMFYHLIKQEYLVNGYFHFIDTDDGWLYSFIRFLLMQLTGNLMQLQVMTVLVEAVPNELSFQNGATLKMIYLIWLPSLLFPDKPLTAPGVFTTTFWPERWFNEGTTIPPGLFGEFFMNFGLQGAIVGAVIFGAIYGFLYSRAVSRCRQVDLGLYAIMAGLLLHYFRGELASVTVLFLSMAIPLVWILRGPSKSERRNLQSPLIDNKFRV